MPRSKTVSWIILGLMVSSSVYADTPLPTNVYGNGVTLTIKTKPFDPKAHVINMCGETVCDIDGKPLYGAYGKIPKQEVASLILETKNWKMSLDVSNMYNPNVNNSNIKKYVEVMPWYDDSYRVMGYFSHDDGDDDMYICLWLVTRVGSFRNYMGDYGALSNLTERVRKDFKIEE